MQHYLVRCRWLLVGFVCLCGPVVCRADVITGAQEHRVKFYLDPVLAGVGETDPIPQTLKADLLQYFADIKTIFERQTLRTFVFDPDTDIVITTTAPQSNSYQGTKPLWQVTNHEIWIHAQKSNNAAFGTYGGFASADNSGAGVAAGLYWDQVYDPSAIQTAAATEQYWRQIDHVVHEFEHVFGAGVGEYYSLNMVQDNTGVGPDMDINLFRANLAEDPYWATRSDYFGDPLQANAWNNSRIGSPKTLSELRDAVHLSDVTVAVLDAGMRGRTQESVPDMQSITVEVRNALTGELIPQALLKVWNIKTVGAYDVTPFDVLPGTLAGQFTFDWDPLRPSNSVSLFNNFDMLKLLKASADGYRDAGMWYSIFDAQSAFLIDGQSQLTLTLSLTAVPEPSSLMAVVVLAGACASLRRRQHRPSQAA